MSFNSWLFLVEVTILFFVVFANLFAEDSLEILQLEQLPMELLPLESFPLEPLPAETLDTFVQEKPDTPANEKLAEELTSPVDTSGEQTEKTFLQPLDQEQDTTDEQEFIKKVIEFKEGEDSTISVEKKSPIRGNYSAFPENPATIAFRDFCFFDLPLGFTLDYRENELTWDDFTKMFEEDGFLSQMDNTLSAESWDIFFKLQKSLLNVGYKNFQFSSEAILKARIKNLGVQWMKFVLADNDKEKGIILADQKGEGSQVVAFLKNSLIYAVPNSFTLANLDVAFGMGLNIYNAVGYAKIDKLKQTAGTGDVVSTVKCEYTRSKFQISGPNSSMGLGLGVMIKGLPNLLFLDEGQAYLSVDDLFAKLTFSDVEKVILSRTVSKKNGELDTVDVDTTYQVGNYNIMLEPEYSLGISYNIFRETFFGSMYLMSKYKEAMLAYDQGISVGADYFPFEWLPIEMRYGLDADPYFSLGIALDLKWQLGVRYVSYGDNPIRASEGFTVGLDFLRIKF